MTPRLRPPRTMAARRAALAAGDPPAASALDALRLAVGTLTALPVRPPRSIAAPVPGRAMMLAPAVALIPGGGAWLAIAGADRAGLSPLVAAVLAIAVLALSTRGLHLDGLADTADGFAASYQRDRALAVMRSGDTGPAGMASVVLVVLLQCAALAQALQGVSRSGSYRLGAVVLIAALAGRAGVVLACTRGIRPARQEGLGATVAGSVSRLALVVVLVIAVAAGAALSGWIGLPWQAGAGAVVASVAVSGVLLHRAGRRFGGMTGDVIGACVEAGTAAALLVLAAA